MKRANILDQKGFTLIEMLVVAPIVILAIGAFLTVIISMTGEVLASRASNNLSYSVQDALNRIEQDVKMSSSFLGINNVRGTAQGYDDGTVNFTNAGGASGTSLVLNMVATTGNPVSTSSSYVYLKNKPNDCTAPQGNVPFTYNIAYFIRNSTLYRRTIMPTNYNDTTNTVCSVPWQQPSCSPSYMDAQTGSVFCKTKDVELVSGVEPGDFSIQYFNSEASTTQNNPATTAVLSADRTAALQSVTTVGVSIRAQQTVAGRTVERTAIMRASRLDSNASAIAVISADTAPSAPKVSTTTGEPTDVTFSWPKVAAATGYTFEYELNNSGNWINGFTNQTTQFFKVTTATHKDLVKARVTAINGSLSSGYGTASVTIPLWTPMNLQNNWVDYSPPFASAGYTKTSSGLIVLKGMVRTGSGIIATLPPGYRPSLGLIFENTSNQTAGRVDINNAGQIVMSTGSNAWFSLDGIAFMPAGATFTAPTFQNGWLNYSPGSGDPNWQNAGYLTDSLGRVQTTGLVRAGTVASGTPIFTLPVASRPTEYLHMLNNVSGGLGHFSIDHSNGAVVAKGGSNAYLSLQSMFYPAGRATGSDCTTQWCNISFVNGWKHYGAPYASPQYTKSADGIVMLKGLINGGSSNGAQITTLPAGYCPAETLLFGTSSNAAWSRLDIIRQTNGTCFVVPAAGSTVWIALDNIHYIAEP